MLGVINFLIQSASVALHDRRAMLDAVYVDLECDLELLGATGVEDRLQVYRSG